MRAVAFCASAAAMLLALLSAHTTYADCRLKTQTAIMCQAPKNAAFAYQEFGVDQARMRTSYNLQLLHESWCALVSESTSQPRTFELYSSGEIATPAGWVDVLQLGFEVDGMSDVRYVAAGYIKGACRRYKYDPSRPPIDPSVPRSPYLPSIPPGGYKIPDNAGAMP